MTTPGKEIRVDVVSRGNNSTNGFYVLDSNVSIANFTNCFTFAVVPNHTSPGHNYYTLMPEDMYWIGMNKEEWEEVVTEHFSPKRLPAQEGSSAHRIEQLMGAPMSDHPSKIVICFPYTLNANDYHWVAYNSKTGMYEEQAGLGGPYLAWSANKKEAMITHIYKRTTKDGKQLYHEGEHFEFSCRWD